MQGGQGQILCHIDETAVIGKDVRIESGAVICAGCEIGEGSIIGANAVLRPRTKIGKFSIFGTLSCSEGNNEIGSYTTIHAQCHITKGVRIGDNCFIAPYFIATNTPEITAGRHGRAPTPDLKILPTIIEDNVRIGVCVRMVPGCTIGHDSIIDMDCLITKDIPAFSRVRGGKDKVGRVIP